MSDNKVVFLNFLNQDNKVKDIGTKILSCRTCENKTYKVNYEEGEDFPSLYCCVCGCGAGMIGWVSDD